MQDKYDMQEVANRLDTSLRWNYLTLPRTPEDDGVVRSIMNTFKRGEGTIVSINGVMYVLAKTTNRQWNQYKAYTYEALPDEYKYPIGVLKMLDDYSFVSEVGYRLDGNTLYLVEGKHKHERVREADTDGTNTGKESQGQSN